MIGNDWDNVLKNEYEKEYFLRIKEIGRFRSKKQNEGNFEKIKKKERLESHGQLQLYNSIC